LHPRTTRCTGMNATLTQSFNDISKNKQGFFPILYFL
jgi:hypothetical protein